MGSTSQPEPLRVVAEIMARHGARCTPQEFHAAVNVTFHDFESEVYDREHADMWGSLPRQFSLLADDCAASDPAPSGPLRLLDIGAGTGLASACILKTSLGSRVNRIDLLDTSPAMLRQATKKAQDWGIPFEIHHGLISDLPAGRTYDIIVTCSVLHHVPDLEDFLAQVRAHHASRGAFIHLQDPNGDYLKDPDLQRRMAETSQSAIPESLQRFKPKRIIGRLYREITGKQHTDPISKTNQALLKSGIVTTPLALSEIYDITDIHVEDGSGISIQRMKTWMPDYDCLSQRSYGFFGKLASTLPSDAQAVEEKLIQERALNGLHIGAAWRLRG
jgi:2-polyprenyl-3-methyl-5-hydroxy-6-metoxy-1,4-benzoquinol methylase